MWCLLSLLACADKPASDSAPSADDTDAFEDTASSSDTSLDTDPPDTAPPEPDEDDDGWGVSEDCDDSDATVHPEAKEICYDGVDQNCSGHSEYDCDEDGHDAEEWGGDDCDDYNPQTHIGASELPGTGVSEDCDAYVDLDGADAWDADLYWAGYDEVVSPSRCLMGMEGLSIIDDIDGDGGQDLFTNVCTGLVALHSGAIGTTDTAIAKSDAWVYLHSTSTSTWNMQILAVAARGQDIDGDGAAEVAFTTGQGIIIFPHSLISNTDGPGAAVPGDPPLVYIEETGEYGEPYSPQLIWERDIDADGTAELLFSQNSVPGEAGSTAGLVQLFSGENLIENAHLLDKDFDWAVEGDEGGLHRLGLQLHGLPDVDGDGYDDLFVSGYSTSALLSGDLITQVELQSVYDVAFAILNHGDSDDVHDARSPGDLDGDGRGDLLLYDDLDNLEIDGFYPEGHIGVFLDLLDGGTVEWLDANANIYNSEASSMGITGLTDPVDLGNGPDVVIAGSHGLGFVPVSSLPLSGSLDLAGWSEGIQNDLANGARLHYPSYAGYSLLTPDLDGDGDADLAVGNYEVSSGFDWSYDDPEFDYDAGLVSLFINPN